ncbi:hypothetical protein DW228_22575 [Bacteroides fragilis]|uniref:Uncharacterized protein n=2 Tax=Bacteroides fragilis TaxID=817 RepID=A0A2K9H1T1_BACFG|nr:hypothetical protein BUN20_17440 [Bacteroides fragilis]EFR56023.1 hypothetical protein BFAG_04722 [Bacteroides fragilis 3_1_12]EKA79720.1 hypothetical protein HMPREF1205_01108 [Bacteroides fragilis HMW 616]EKA88755.1 hypothetical protein HMPREF1203_03598 [Bacteroides fragilis HMW 610]QLK80826.1 hypothetical protein DBK98_000870 [Bacteroides sp. PHL 2737]
MDTTTNSAIFFQTFLYNSYNQHYKETHFIYTKKRIRSTQKLRSICLTKYNKVKNKQTYN